MSTVIGAPVRLTASFYDATSTLVDPTTVTATITLPDGSAAGGAASKDSPGKYHYDYTPAQAGIHQFYFVGTGSNASTQTPDVFTVQPATTAALISLADAKEQLNKAPTSVNPTTSSDDAEILGFIRSATNVVNFLAGYTTRTTFTEEVTPNWGGPGPNLGVYGSGYVSITLSRTPLLSVQSIQPRFYNVAAADVSGLVIDTEAGIVWMPTNQLFLGPCLITYTAGRTSTVDISSAQSACRIIVQSLWETQRGPAFSGRPGFDAEEMVPVPSLNMLIPRHAAELLEFSDLHAAPGFA